jgi:hypothetical protein
MSLFYGVSENMRQEKGKMNLREIQMLRKEI